MATSRTRGVDNGTSVLTHVKGRLQDTRVLAQAVRGRYGEVCIVLESFEYPELPVYLMGCRTDELSRWSWKYNARRNWHNRVHVVMCRFSDKGEGERKEQPYRFLITYLVPSPPISWYVGL